VDSVEGGTNLLSSILTLTRRPKEMNQPMDRRRSTGQWMKVPENGRSQRRARMMDNAARISV
jgi:hypothetical protein